MGIHARRARDWVSEWIDERLDAAAQVKVSAYTRRVLTILENRHERIWTGILLPRPATERRTGI